MGIALFLLAGLLHGEPDRSGFVVHEWGTFTTLVDSKGEELAWNAFRATAPLPSFVHGFGLKVASNHKVRMETPVIYFYADRPLEVSVAVDFVGGVFTEWYPAARLDDGAIPWRRQPTTLTWSPVLVSPNFDDALPTTLHGGHYFAARGVASTPLRVPDEKGVLEAEKLLFYRGTADFDAPLVARFEAAGRRVVVHNRTSWPIDDVLFFERRGDDCDSQRATVPAGGEVAFERRDDGFVEDFRLDELKEILRGQGLREDEAQAMVDTWREDWFFAGTRVFYTVPREFTDQVLPLHIDPKPDRTERVLLGRVELLGEDLEMEVQLAAAHASEDPAGTMASLERRHGRAAIAYLSALTDDPGHPDLAKGAELLIGHVTPRR